MQIRRKSKQKNKEKRQIKQTSSMKSKLEEDQSNKTLRQKKRAKNKDHRTVQVIQITILIYKINLHQLNIELTSK